MSNKKCPCQNCICIAMCRHKDYADLFDDCILLKEYEPKYKLIFIRNEARIHYIERILKPTKWEFLVEGIYSDAYKVVRNKYTCAFQ